MEYLLPYLCMVTVPHIVVGLERMLDYRGVRLARFHCTYVSTCDEPHVNTHRDNNKTVEASHSLP